MNPVTHKTMPKKRRRSVNTNGRGLLEKALVILSDRRRWIKGDMALTESGYVCAPTSPNAVKFCLLGALDRAYYETRAGALARTRATTSLRHAIAAHYPEEDPTGLASFNDKPRRPHRTIVRLLELAIKDAS